jgi:hypothetical protein
MSNSQSKFFQDLVNVEGDAVADALANLHRDKELVKRLDAAGSTPPLPRPATLGGDLLFRLAQLQLEQAQAVLRASNQYAERLFGWLQQRTGPTRHLVSMRGRPKSEAKPRTPQSVVNHTRHAGELSFQPQPLRDREGTKARRPIPIGCTASPTHLGVGERAELDITVSLADDFFRSGQCYFGEVELLLRGDVVERLALEIEVRDE